MRISHQVPGKGPASTKEKLALFRRLFRGRGDVFAPACANEWRQGICEKPRVACRDCKHRELLPLSDAAIYGHLAGEHTIGPYPLLENDHCHLLAVDIDEQDWRDDARAFLRSCRELELSSYDRLCPNQDILPKGGFGNLIAPRAPTTDGA
ncbi:hypothetical protein KQ300_09405 [Synechococcus sp. CS-1331]|uniref:TOTE conflict system archaeo-eukaryotic primase domain-containing protein n=1 Tax=Synechococcus sp. CS-1331 TaxID=2847973 RepID=UPI00223C091C|nr:hypothetical protein [Synechococcus sp. CS-1331]MCT0228396.1 hypothetical protein [Synechococcus sp. CS-1331]